MPSRGAAPTTIELARIGTVTDARKRYDELMRDLVNPSPRVEPQLAAE